MKRLAFQLSELRFLVRGLRAYARRRTPRVRRVLAVPLRWSRPGRLRERRRLAGSLPPVLTSIPEELGFSCITGLVSDAAAAAVVEARKLLAGADIEALRRTRQDLHLVTVPLAGRLHPGSAILQLALDPMLMRLVSDYVGMLPVIESIWILYSPNERTVDGTSQHYHLDGQDVRTVKVFVHLDDVDAEDGPLTAVVARSSELLARRIHYRKNEQTKRVADAVVNESVGLGEIRALTGPRGTVYIVDTDRCFHFGSRAGKRPRKLLMIQYYSPFAFVLPRDWTRALPLATLGRDTAFSAIEQLVLGAR